MLRAIGTIIIGILLVIPLSMVLLFIPAYYLLPFSDAGTIWFRHYRKKPSPQDRIAPIITERCAQCGTLQDGNWKYCEQCGAPRTDVASLTTTTAGSRSKPLLGKPVAVGTIVVFALLALMMYQVNKDRSSHSPNLPVDSPKVQQVVTAPLANERSEPRQTTGPTDADRQQRGQ